MADCAIDDGRQASVRREISTRSRMGRKNRRLCFGFSIGLLAGVTLLFYGSGINSSPIQRSVSVGQPSLGFSYARLSDAQSRSTDEGTNCGSRCEDKKVTQVTGVDSILRIMGEVESLKMALQTQKDAVEELKERLRQNRIDQRTNCSAGCGGYPKVKYRRRKSRTRVLVTGGGGFLGSHLVDRLMSDGYQVLCLDNFYTGSKTNIHRWIGHPNFELVMHDVVNPIYLEADQIYHLASPASPPHYMFNPVKTIKTNTLGTINMLGLARRTKARILLASTSEVYGDPLQHPQSEDYWGNVNPVGPRSCYDEGKRIAEALMVAYHQQENVDIRIARIFNTFGPRMDMDDGRVVSNFIIQALQNQPITVYGNGSHTRSFQYVSDLIDGMVRLMQSNVTVPVNFGNPEEMTILDFAHTIKELTGCNCSIIHLPTPVDDPKRRRPNISRAWNLLQWKPRVPLIDGLRWTIDYFKSELQDPATEL